MIDPNKKIKFKDFEKYPQWIVFLFNSIPVLMGGFIFLNPFPHTTTIKEIIFYPTVFFVFVLLLFKKIDFSFKTPLSIPFSFFILWAFFSIFFALDKGNSFHDFFAHLIKYILFYYILINFFDSKKRLVALSWTIIISATIFSLGILFYWYIILGNPLSSRLGLTFKNAATTINGFITLYGLILSLHHFQIEKILYRRMILIISIISLFAASFLAQSRSTLIAMCLVIIVLYFKQKKKLILFFTVALIFIATMPIKNRLLKPGPYYDDRIGLIYYSLEIIKDYPIIGTGFAIDTFRDAERINPQTYMARIPERYRKPPYPYLWPHNMFLSLGVQLGFVGIVLFLWILFVAANMAWKLISSGKDDFIKNWGISGLALLVMFIVKGLFDPIFTHFVDVIFYTILSMITIAWRFNENVDTLVVKEISEFRDKKDSSRSLN